MKKDPLKEYNRKRNFKVTKEPSGSKKVMKTSSKLIFVVQEHHASRLHYDFRLELEGVLKSWAVPKGPSLDPKDKRLAVQTEDHPIPYAKFHGTIPKGEYGGGEVFIWDNGTWESESEDPVAALKEGELKFKLKGKKLKGSFVLVRTKFRGDEGGKNWLLIKHKGDVKTSAKKTAKKTISKKKSSKVALGSDPWPEFIPPQLPRLVSEVPEEGKWIHEMKHDGYRIQAHLKDGIGNLYTRTGLNWSNHYPQILNSFEGLQARSAIVDGEIVALDERGHSSFQALQNAFKDKEDHGLRYYVFDLLFLNGKDLRNFPLTERKKLLKEILKGSDNRIVFSEHISEQGVDFYRLACEHKLEGIVSKLAESTYHSGRNDLWVKTKCSSRQEFVVVGWTQPKGERIGIGALLLGTYEDGKLRYAGKVGTGFNQKSLKEIKAELKPLEVEESLVEVNPPRGKGIHWVKPAKVCEVSFSNWTAEGILRTPVFMGMREDKPTKDVHMEKEREISSPDKIIFNEEGITKSEVADFYQAISKEMLPYLAHRPLSLVRCPQGSEGECFFQKHFTGTVPPSFHTFPVKEEKGSGIYLAIDSREGLMELVQLNAYEIHAWNCQKEDYLRPDQIVMDLDPGPGVGWKEVVEAAFELREMLEDLGLVSFVKLTGGKGLHIHIPIAPIYDWPSVKAFSQSLALELQSRDPKKYIANMSKKLRKNRIFIDYLRNGYGATAVVPYSLRARPLSAVALPVDWKELRRIKGPQEYTMKKALKKIKSRAQDPWKGMLKLKQKIAILSPVKHAKVA